MQTILLLCVIACNSGYGFGYDGCVDKEYYFQVNTPTADYGIVVSEDSIYCDTIFYKKSN